MSLLRTPRCWRSRTARLNSPKFRDQAVIAIDARLFEEVPARARGLTGALEQADGNIRRAERHQFLTGRAGAGFRGHAADATRLCEGNFGTLHRYDGQKFYPAAMLNTPRALAELQRERGPFFLNAGMRSIECFDQDRGSRHRRCCRTGPQSGRQAGGARSLIAVPMLKENDLIGAILILSAGRTSFHRQADTAGLELPSQAVIAIDNTRLLNELRQSLQQQTATTDVLKVISRSAFDLQAVLDTLVETAAQALRGRRDRPTFGAQGRNLPSRSQLRGREPAHRLVGVQESTWLSVAYRPERGSVVGRTLLEGNSVHVDDVRADPEYVTRYCGGRADHARCPLLRDRIPIGVMVLVRGPSVRSPTNR